MKAPDAVEVGRMIERAALRQLEHSESGRAVSAACATPELRAHLESLIAQIAGNAANPVVAAFEDALDLMR